MALKESSASSSTDTSDSEADKNERFKDAINHEFSHIYGKGESGGTVVTQTASVKKKDRNGDVSLRYQNGLANKLSALLDE